MGLEKCIIPRYYFLDIIININMSTGKLSITLCLLLGVVLSVQTPSNGMSQFYSDYRQGIAYKKGLTFQATIWPQ